MKTVLIIAYAFPPIGGVGAIRIVKFAKYLAEFGWRPVILTVDHSDEFVLDHTLQEQLPVDLPIYRTRIWEIFNAAQLKRSSSKLSGTSLSQHEETSATNKISKGLIRRARHYIKATLRHIYFAIRIPDEKIGWWPFAQRQGLEIIRQEKIDLIFATTPSYTALLIGQTLKRKTGVPFIVDYRDEWSSIQYRDYPWNPITRAINRQLEKRVLRSADAIVGLSQSMLENLSQEGLLPPAIKQLSIPNGFDSADYPADRPRKSAPQNARFTITYTGSFYGQRQSPKYFLAALAQLFEEHSELQEQIAVRFIGSIYHEHERFIAQNGLADVVSVRGVVSHAEAITEQQNADLLLLIVGKGAGSHMVLTGKIFEYLGAGRPILALVPIGGAAAHLVESTRTGHVVGAEDIQAIQEAIKTALYEWKAGTSSFSPDPDAIKRYERKTQAESLANFFNQVTA